MNSKVTKKNEFDLNGTTSHNNISDSVANKNQNINQNQNLNYVNVVPDFANQELDAVIIPKKIAKEIRMEKYKIAFIIFLSTLIIAVSTFFLVIYYTTSGPGETMSAIGIQKESLPYPVLTIIGVVLPLIVIVINLIRLSHLSGDVKRFKSELIMGRERIPMFIFSAYKKLIKNHIYLNWLCFTIYLYGGIILGILIGVNQIESVNLNSTITILIIILSSTLVIHLFSLIFNYKRKGSIDVYYGYEIVTLPQQIQLRKEANKISMIFFFTILCIVLFVIFIPLLLVRKKQGKKIFWFL